MQEFFHIILWKKSEKKQISGSLFCSDEWVNKAGPIFNTPLHLIYCYKLLKKCEKEVHNYNTTHVLIRSFGRLLLSAWSQGTATCYCGFLISSDLSRFFLLRHDTRGKSTREGGRERERVSFLLGQIGFLDFYICFVKRLYHVMTCVWRGRVENSCWYLEDEKLRLSWSEESDIQREFFFWLK